MKSLLAAFLLVAVLPAAAYASDQSQLKLNVYPLECVFDQVNDGSNTIVFLTPVECGQNIFTNLPPEIQTQAPIAVTTPPDSVRPAPPPATPIVETALWIAAHVPVFSVASTSWALAASGVIMAQLVPLVSRAIVKSLLKMVRYFIGLIRL